MLILFSLLWTLSSTVNAVTMENFRWVVPSDKLPDGLTVMHSNNNVDIKKFNGTLFMAFRTAPTHFASKKTLLSVISNNENEGNKWNFETTFSVGSDLREPRFVATKDHLYLYAVKLGANGTSFTPKLVYRWVYQGPKQWKEIDHDKFSGEVIWDIKEHNDQYYMTSYKGGHYTFKPKPVEVNFRVSRDGLNWSPLPGHSTPVVYTGGVSEVSIEWDDQGTMWGETRLEDGDSTGWGSQVITASANDYGTWNTPKESDPNRYDSSKIIKYKNEFYVVARRSLGGQYDRHMRGLPFNSQRWFQLIRYSLTKMRTAVYHLNKQTHELEWMMDFPSAGDTAYMSVVPLSESRFLIANYTSQLSKNWWTWFRGQTAIKGTSIYLAELNFDSPTPQQSDPEMDSDDP